MTIHAAALTHCRACGARLATEMVDLGVMPLANSYLRHADLAVDEPAFPLRAMVCDVCLLVQLDYVVDSRAVFSDYAYFSSYSASWVAHARRFVDAIVDRLSLGPDNQVIEIASNDGYLLKNFVARGIRCLGIEPAANVAAVAIDHGVPTRIAFFGTQTARQLVQEQRAADLIIGNNVLAHVPALSDFVDGVRLALKPAGVATFEVPHLLRLVLEGQFDTIYHEHFSYFTLLAVERVFATRALEIFDVEELPTHGGSLRLFVQHAGGPRERTPALERVRSAERAAGLGESGTYRQVADAAARVREDLLRFLHTARNDGRRVAAYGAPAKGNTLLNYCGIGPELIEFTVDRNPAKQNRFLPGSRIPVYDVDALKEWCPDFVVLLPWNLREELIAELAWIAAWGGRFVVPIPRLEILPAGAPVAGVA
jgi:SAM-dependent methyltransferase